MKNVGEGRKNSDDGRKQIAAREQAVGAKRTAVREQTVGTKQIAAREQAVGAKGTTAGKRIERKT